MRKKSRKTLVVGTGHLKRAAGMVAIMSLESYCKRALVNGGKPSLVIVLPNTAMDGCFVQLLREQILEWASEIKNGNVTVETNPKPELEESALKKLVLKPGRPLHVGFDVILKAKSLADITMRDIRLVQTIFKGKISVLLATICANDEREIRRADYLFKAMVKDGIPALGLATRCGLRAAGEQGIWASVK